MQKISSSSSVGNPCTTAGYLWPPGPARNFSAVDASRNYKPHLVLLLNLFQVSSVGDTAANAGPCPKTKAKCPACTEVLSVRAGRQSGDQIKNSFRDFRSTTLNLVKSVGRPETLNCRSDWLLGLKTGHPDGELLHDLSQVGDGLVQTNKFTSKKVLVHASSPLTEQNDGKRQEEPHEGNRDQKKS